MINIDQVILETVKYVNGKEKKEKIIVTTNNIGDEAVIKAIIEKSSSASLQDIAETFCKQGFERLLGLTDDNTWTVNYYSIVIFKNSRFNNVFMMYINGKLQLQAN